MTVRTFRSPMMMRMVGMCKMKFKKAFCALVICVMTCSLTSLAVNAASFSDIEGHWAQNAIEKWSEKGIIQGYDGKFNPDNSITRGDMAVILNRMMNYSEKSDNVFTDLDNNAYYTDSILKLNNAGIMFGSDGCVRPKDFITREEAFVMLNRIYNFKGDSLTTGFKDEMDISVWAKKAILAMCENKIINGSDGKINPKLNITRAEIIQLLENISSYLNSISSKVEDELDIDLGKDKNDNTSSSGISIGGGSNRPSGNGGGSNSSSSNNNGNNNSSTDDNINDDSSQEPDNDTENSIGGDDIEAGGIW